MQARSPFHSFTRFPLSRSVTLVALLVPLACGQMSDVVAPRLPQISEGQSIRKPLAITIAATTTVVTFEDLDDPYSLHVMWPHNPWYGITFDPAGSISHWDNIYYGHPHSGSIFLFNGLGSDNESMTFAKPVTFNGAWVGSPHDVDGDGNKEFWFEGFLGGVKVGESSHTALVAEEPMKYLAADFPGAVDKVVMRRNYGWWVMDDISYTEIVVNLPPVAVIGGNAGGPPPDHYEGFEGSSVMLDASASSDPEGGSLTYAWDLDNDGQYDDATGATVLHAFADNGTYTIGVQVTDSAGLASTSATTVTVTNVAPSASFGNDGPVNEGTDFELSLTGASDASLADEAAGFEFAFDCGGGYGAYSSVSTASCPTNDNGSPTVKGKLRDKDGGETEYSATVTVNNVAPSLGPITVSGDPVATGTLVTASASFSDPGSADTHFGEVQWDAADVFVSATPGVDQPTKGLVATSAALPAGVYTVTLKVTDDDGGYDTRTAPTYVVVYDPSGRFVTGGGWFISPASACAPVLCTTFTGAGKASFGFVSSQLKSRDVPSGEIEFDFQAGGLNFKSTSYESLQVAGSHAQFRGAGTVNGVGGYSFQITATDGQATGGGGADKLRVKIWNSDGVVYDNQRNASGAPMPDDLERGTIIGGGSIVIHN